MRPFYRLRFKIRFDRKLLAAGCCLLSDWKFKLKPKRVRSYEWIWMPYEFKWRQMVICRFGIVLGTSGKFRWIFRTTMIQVRNVSRSMTGIDLYYSQTRKFTIKSGIICGTLRFQNGCNCQIVWCFNVTTLLLKQL